MVVIGPVDPLVGVVDSESGGAIDLCVDDDRLPAAIHADAADVGRLAAVHPEHVAEWESQVMKIPPHSFFSAQGLLFKL